MALFDALFDPKATLASFREWREAEGLSFDPRFVPKSFDSLADLDHRYAQNEYAAKAKVVAEKKRAPASAQTFVTKVDLRKSRDADLKMIGKFVAMQLAPLARRISELETLALKEGGVWTPTGTFKEGEVVTHGGALWVCKSAPTHGAKPGQSNKSRLLFKTRPPKETK